jgi:hypothetical protein
LEQLGFKNDEHFVGYASESQLFEILDRYLKDESARSQITCIARDLVMKEHTYDARVDRILQVFAQDNGSFFAPARKWSAGWVDFVYLHYYCRRSRLGNAKDKLWQLLWSSPALAILGFPLFLRCLQNFFKMPKK